MIIGIQ